MSSSPFRTETRRLLDIVVNSLYSHPDVFLRELVSNASDAIDRLRFEQLGTGDGGTHPVSIRPDPEAGTLTISDGGIGMTAQELSENLGTIAGSGTRRFVEGLEQGLAPDLIGRFGVGFYSAFMVADRIEVISRRAGPDEAGTRWESDGREFFTVEPHSRDGHGTDVILHLKAGMEEYLDGQRLATIVEKYSDYISYPVELVDARTGSRETLNSRIPLWLSPERDVTAEQYDDFFGHLTGERETPMARLVFHAEGTVEFHALLFIPPSRTVEMMVPDGSGGLDLYSRRVKVIEGCRDLLPRHFRFVAGVVECRDLPLNISREMLQESPALGTIRKALTRKVTDWLSRLSREDPGLYRRIFSQFGSILREGLLVKTHEGLEDLLMYRTLASPAEPVMLSGLKHEGGGEPARLCFVTVPEGPAAASSPHLEALAQAGGEALLFDSPVDEFAVPAIAAYLGRRLVPLDRESGDEDLTPEERAARGEAEQRLSGLTEYMERILGGTVSAVRVSLRLRGSPCVVVTSRSDPGMLVRSFLKASGKDPGEVPGVLEINPDHPMILEMHRLYGSDRSGARLESLTRLARDLGLVLAGSPPADPAAFAAEVAGLVSGV